MTVYLLSMFSEGVATIRRRAETERNEIAAILRDAIPIGASINPKIVASSSKKLMAIESRNNRRIKLLTPTRQILRIFVTLFLSLLFIMIYKLLKDHTINLYNRIGAVVLLSLSVICFVIGILVLWQVARAVIETKIIMAQEKSAISVETQ